MVLSDEERSKFAAYCEQCAHDDGLILEQMAKVLSPTIWDAVSKQRKAEIGAYTIVAGILRSTHSDKVGG